MLISETLFGTRNKIQEAIDLLKKHEPPEGYYLAFSGGKDSVCIYRLAEMAGVKFDANHNLTTVDFPELMKFIKKEYPQVKINHPKRTMWELIVHKGYPPTRMARYCCDLLKEKSPKGRVLMMGTRCAEGSKRSGRTEITEYKRRKIVNPIYYWCDDEVWDFIETEGLRYCSLYDDPGYSRLGCIMCPMANLKNRIHHKERYPKYYQAYLRAFDKMLKERKRRQKQTTWETSQEVMDRWLSP